MDQAVDPLTLASCSGYFQCKPFVLRQAFCFIYLLEGFPAGKNVLVSLDVLREKHWRVHKRVENILITAKHQGCHKCDLDMSERSAERAHELLNMMTISTAYWAIINSSIVGGTQDAVYFIVTWLQSLLFLLKNSGLAFVLKWKPFIIWCLWD